MIVRVRQSGIQAQALVEFTILCTDFVILTDYFSNSNLQPGSCQIITGSKIYSRAPLITC